MGLSPLQIEELYRRYSFAVFRRCLALLRNEAEAHDMAAEVFTQVLEQPDRFMGRSSPVTYLFALATHLCLNRLRNQRARDETWLAGLSRHIEQQTRQHDAGCSLEAQRLLAYVLTATDASLAEIAWYHFVDGMTQGEIAEAVGLSRVTINHRLRAFRERAAAMIAEGVL